MTAALDFTPRSASAWALACIAELSPAARQLLHECHAEGGYIDPADAWLAQAEGKTQTQARSAARNAARPLGSSWQPHPRRCVGRCQ